MHNWYGHGLKAIGLVIEGAYFPEFQHHKTRYSANHYTWDLGFDLDPADWGSFHPF